MHLEENGKIRQEFCQQHSDTLKNNEEEVDWVDG